MAGGEDGDELDLADRDDGAMLRPTGVDDVEGILTRRLGPDLARRNTDPSFRGDRVTRWLSM